MIYVIWYMVKHEEPREQQFRYGQLQIENKSQLFFDVQLFVFYFLAQAKEFLK